MSFSCVPCYGQVTYSPVANPRARAVAGSAARCAGASGRTDQGDQSMTLIKRASTVLFAVATAGAVVGMSAAPAMAATTLKVKVSSGGSYTAKASKTVLKDNGVSVTCTSTST